MKRIILCLVAVLVAGAGRADAAWGLRGGATFDPDQVHLGAHVVGGELFSDGWFIPNIEIGFSDDLTLVALNPELVYKFAKRSRADWGFYIGGGLGLNFYQLGHRRPRQRLGHRPGREFPGRHEPQALGRE